MKIRTNLLLAAILLMLSAIVSILLWGRKTTVITTATPALHIQVQAMPPLAQAVAESAAPANEPITITVPAALASSVKTEAAPVAEPSKVVQSDGNPQETYTAKYGDTLSNVAAGLMGTDTKKNRQAVSIANPSLQTNPDRVLAGQMYLRSALDTAMAAPKSETPSAAIPTTQPEAVVAARPSSDRELKYTAQPGDSVSALAAGLLGANSKDNRDAIINQNQSLQQDPNLIVVGKTYSIPAGDGLSAAPAPIPSQQPRPTAQPDADEVVKTAAGRELRYTARAGDNVSKLAKVLLGSDTPANRSAIIDNNVSLKSDPDRVIVGQSYWIPAPTASIDTP